MTSFDSQGKLSLWLCVVVRNKTKYALGPVQVLEVL